MNVAEAVAGALAQSGITDLFGLLGDGNLELVTAAVRQHGMRFHAARHERPCGRRQVRRTLATDRYPSTPFMERLLRSTRRTTARVAAVSP